MGLGVGKWEVVLHGEKGKGLQRFLDSIESGSRNYRGRRLIPPKRLVPTNGVL